MKCRHRPTLVVAALTLGASVLALPAAAQTAPAERAAPAPRPRSPWRFGTSLAVQDISGNKQLRILQSTIRAEHQRPDRLIFALKLEGGYGTSGGEEKERRLSSSLRLDWTPRARVSPFIGVDWDYNRILRINARVSGGAGANLNFSRRDSARVTLALGVVEEYRNTAARGTSPGSETNDTRFHVRLSLARTMPSGVQAEVNVKYQPVVDRLASYLFKADGTLRIALTTRLRWETTYRWWRDSSPAAEVRKDDRALVTGLAIQW